MKQTSYVTLKIPTFLSSLGLSLALTLTSISPLLYKPQLAQAQSPKDYLILVDGNNDCCAYKMEHLKKYANAKNMEIINVPWSNFKEGWESGSALSDGGKVRFVASGKSFLRKLPAGTNIYMVGHSWGGDSALRLVREYSGSNVNFRLLALIDPVGPGGMRQNLRGNTVPSKVEYFYNRWQKNEPFPNDFWNSGSISCRAKECDQSEQSSHKREDGTSVRVSCRADEVTCEGWRLPGCNLSGCWDGSNGTKMKPAGHAGLATDGWVETSVSRIIDKLKSPKILALNDIGIMTQKAQEWAGNNRFAGAIPTLHWGMRGNEPIYGAVLINQNAGEFRNIPLNIHPTNLGTTEGKKLILQGVMDFAVKNGYAGAIPTFHWGGSGSSPVYGAILINRNAGEFRDVPLNIHPENLGTAEGQKKIWQGVMDFAVNNGYAGAIPTLHWGGSGSNPVYGAILINRSAGEFRDIPLK